MQASVAIVAEGWAARYARCRPAAPLGVSHQLAFKIRAFSSTSRYFCFALRPLCKHIVRRTQQKVRPSLCIRDGRTLNAFGGSRGIRTPVGVTPNGFQDRLVMTTSICFHRMLAGTALCGRVRAVRAYCIALPLQGALLGARGCAKATNAAYLL